MNQASIIIKKLNEHYFYNLQLGISYLSLSAIVSKKGMYNLAEYIKRLANDKLTIHKDKLFNYLKKINNGLEGCDTLPISYNNLNTEKEIIDFILNCESEVREKINEICKNCLKEDDFESFHFLTWFVNDGVKDYYEVKKIANLFKLSDDKLAIDQSIKEMFCEHH